MNMKRQYSFTLMYLIDRTSDRKNNFSFFRTEYQLLPIRSFPQAQIQTKKHRNTVLRHTNSRAKLLLL